MYSQVGSTVGSQRSGRRHDTRVSRLLLGVCLAHVWLMKEPLNAGVWVGKRGLRRRVDRHKVRQLSYF